MTKFLLKFFPWLILLILLCPAIYPILSPGLLKTDDGAWMILRQFAFHQTLLTGQFPVRFLSDLNHGYGYPVLNFLYPLPFYVGEVIHLMGFNFVDSLKIVFSGSLIVGSIFMYAWLRNKYGRLAALIAALVYCYSPYHLFDIYKRGSIGEAVAFVFVPLCFYFSERLSNKITYRIIGAYALSLFFLILSHNVLAFIFLPFLFVYSVTLVLKNKGKGSGPQVLAWGLGLVAATFFWFPAIFEISNTIALNTVVSNYSQYFLSWSDNFITLVGLSTVIIFIISALIFAKHRPDPPILVIALAGIVAVFLATPVSSVFWELTILPRVIQFPWRFLSIAVFSSAVLCGYLISIIHTHKIRTVIFIVLLSIIVIFQGNWNVEKEYYPESYYVTNDDSTTVKNEYMPRWVKKIPSDRAISDLTIINGRGETKGNAVNLSGNGIVQINKVYFPGFEVLVDNKLTSFDFESTGFPQIEVSTGEHIVTWKFKETPLRLGADIASIVAGIVIFYFLFIKSTKKTLS